jgi:hypothetical protein
MSLHLDCWGCLRINSAQIPLLGLEKMVLLFNLTRQRGEERPQPVFLVLGMDDILNSEFKGVDKFTEVGYFLTKFSKGGGVINNKGNNFIEVKIHGKVGMGEFRHGNIWDTAMHPVDREGGNEARYIFI